MQLKITCQLCGKVLAQVQKDVISDDDIAMYEASSSCNTVQQDGVTVDGQSDIQATRTVE